MRDSRRGVQQGHHQNGSNMQMFFQIHKDYITKGLHIALLNFEQESFKLKMADLTWLQIEQTKIVHQKGIATNVVQLNIT